MTLWNQSGTVVPRALSAVVWLCAAVAQGRTEYSRQDFETWGGGAPWSGGASAVGRYTNANWVLWDAQVYSNRTIQPFTHAGKKGGLLQDYPTGTNSWLRTPWLSNGVGQVTWWSANRSLGYTNVFGVEYSTNGSAWSRLATYTCTTYTVFWAGYTNVADLWPAGYLRWRKLWDGKPDGRLCFDDLTVYNPAGLKLAGLEASPAAPTLEDTVSLRCTLAVHPRVSLSALKMWFRFGGQGEWASRPLLAGTGSVYRVDPPIQPGRAGLVQYYVEASYTGFDNGTVYLPAGGRDAPASYTASEPGGTASDSRQFGPCSRRTPLVLSEIMYHPPGTSALEYVELYNSDPVGLDVSGFRLGGDVAYTFPSNTVLGARQRLVVAADPGALSVAYPVSNVLGPWAGALSDGGGVVRLRNAQNAVLLEAAYEDRAPWPIEADGAGHALVLTRPDYGEGDVQGWQAGERVGGTPGWVLGQPGDGLVKLRINEWLAHTDWPQVDFIELYNYHTQAVDLSGCVLTDAADTPKYVIPAGTWIAARGFLSWDEETLDFGLSMSGGDLYLLNPTGSRVLQAVRYEAQQNGVSSGRFPDGAEEFHELAGITREAANAGLKTREVTIGELMYHPISGEDDDEYVELHNRGTNAADVGYWQFTDGIAYIIPPGTTIPAGGYLVVARNKARLLGKYPQLNAANLVGDYTGQLSDRGERVALSKPDNLGLPYQDLVVVDEVTYSDGWGQWADGGGSSLELIDPRSDNRRGMNWAGSDETQKAPWTEIDYTDSVDNGIGTTPTHLRIYGLSAGDYLLDNVSVTVGAVTHLEDNFESGLSTNWTTWGNHVRSALWPQEGFESARSLCVRASSRGENAGGWENGSSAEWFWNRIEVPLTPPLSGGQVATIRARARWLRGFPYLVLGSSGYWIETGARLTVPDNLGTPAQANSRARANAGPAIGEVQHDPVLPAAGQAVRVTCRVYDPDGVAAVRLLYRIDPAYATNVVALRDDGAAPDRWAGDGLYSGTIVGQAANVTVAFVVDARDGASVGATSRFPGDAPAGAPPLECLVRFGVPTPNCGSFGVYRLWVSAVNHSRWLAINGPTRNGYSKEPIDSTFVLDGRRAVYNAGSRWRGNVSDWTDPQSSGAYSVDVPKADRVLGATAIKLDLSGQGGGDGTRQLEAFAAWVGQSMSIPSPHLRRVRVYFNSSDRTVMHDYYMPSRDFCTSYYEDPDPQVFKNVGWGADPFVPYRNAWGQKKQSRYRWHLSLRRPTVPNDDYSAVYRLVDAFANPNPGVYVPRVKALCDMDNWTAFFALCGAMGAWDHYGYSNPHNMFLYAPPHDRSRLFLHDMDHALLTGGSGVFPGGTVPGKLFTGTPEFRRQYLQFLDRLLEGPFDVSRAKGYLDDWYAAYQANGMPATAPAAILASLTNRIAAVEAQLSAAPSAFAIGSNGGAGFSTGGNPVTLSGTAPIAVYTLRVNGVDHPVSWSTVTNWSMRVWLESGPNDLTIAGADRHGATACTDTIAVTFTGTNADPSGQVVFNELMYHWPQPSGSWVELRNLSANWVNLSGWRLDGLDCTLGAGTFLGPTGYVVVADSAPGYAASFTNVEVVVGTFSGNMDNGGERLRLWRPAGGTNEALVDEVTYDDAPPWPAGADGGGLSLQLRDAFEDNDRAANWAVDPVRRFTPGRPNSVTTNLPALPRVWINELMAGNAGYLRDNAFEFEPWLELYNAGSNAVDLGGGLALYPSLTNFASGGWSFAAGESLAAAGFKLVWMDGETGETAPDALHAGWRLPSPTGAVALVWHTGGDTLVVDWLSYGGVGTNRSFGSYPDGDLRGRRVFDYPTAGSGNNPTAAVVGVKLNEWQASNQRTLADPADGEYQDWFELYNPGPAANLTGYRLSDSAGNPSKYVIPAGTVAPAGGFVVVWADGEPEQAGLHADFSLSADGEWLGLYAPDGTMLDGLSFGPQETDLSEGRYPDGALARWPMAIPTPGASNVLFEVLSQQRLTNGAVRLNWRTRAAWRYRVLWQEGALTTGAWQVWGDWLMSTGATYSATLPAPTNALPRFYRLEQHD